MSKAAEQPSIYLHAAIIWYDLETTGLDTNKADTIELAAKVEPACKTEYEAYYRGRQDWKSLPIVAESFSSFVYPDGGVIPAEASNIHHIVIETVKDAPKFKDAALKFVEWLGKWRKWLPHSCNRIILVAHNNFNYDSRILKRQCKVHEVELPSFIEWGDTLPTFRDCFPHMRKFNMQDLTKQWVEPKIGKQAEQDHRAAADVEMLILLVRHCPDTAFLLETLMKGTKRL
jgi:DNA polymerase III epsilon subunit-like protein